VAGCSSDGVSVMGAAHALLSGTGAEIVHPLQDEEWGVRRFFVRDPNGRVVNVLSHRGRADHVAGCQMPVRAGVVALCPSAGRPYTSSIVRRSR